jgi:type IV pilus assembly protein PilQ
MLSVMHRYWKILLSCFFLTALCTASYADGAVTDLKVVEGANTVKIEIVSNGPVQHRAKSITQPGRAIVIDVFPAKLGSGVKALYTVNKGLVSNVRVKQYTDNTVRVTVEAVSLPEYQIVTSSGSTGLTVAVSTSTMAEGKATTAPVEVAAAPKQPAPKAHTTKTPQAQPAQEPEEPVKVLTNRDVKAEKNAASGLPNSPAFQGQGESTSALRFRAKPRPVHHSKMVSLDFVNADLVYVIKVLAKEMNRNVYVGPGVEGSVTVTLKSVPVEGALALILKMQENEFDYKVVEPNTIIVAPKEKLGTIPDDILQKGPIGGANANQVPKDAIRQEVLLEKAPAAKVISFLESQYKHVKFTPHPTMNGFYVLGSRKDVLQIKSEIGNLDRVPDPPAKPEREFIRINYADMNEAKSLLATLVPDVQYNVDAYHNTLILEGSPSAIEQVKELLDQIDRPKDMVMIDVKVVDLGETGSKALGVTWGSTSGPGTLATTFTEGTYGQSIQRTAATGPGGATGLSLDPVTILTASEVGIPIQAFARTPLAITSNLQFLITQGEAKIMASPRVGTIAGKPALIHIGDKFPIVYFDPRAGQFQVQYVDIGIKLDVKVDIKGDGNIEADLNPEVSTLVGLVNNQYPRTTVRRIQTVMRIKDGDTIVLGGLITEQDVSSVQKIPLLGDLPIIGAMFRNVSQNKSRNEVVLMVTPHIMR